MSDKRFYVINHYDVPKQIYDEEKDTLFGMERASYLLNYFAEENKKLKKEMNECEKFRYAVFKKIGEYE